MEAKMSATDRQHHCRFEKMICQKGRQRIFQGIKPTGCISNLFPVLNMLFPL
jgi:hypothetical protein